MANNFTPVHLYSSVIREKGESQNGCFKKTKHVKFSEKRTFLSPWLKLRITLLLCKCFNLIANYSIASDCVKVSDQLVSKQFCFSYFIVCYWNAICTVEVKYLIVQILHCEDSGIDSGEKISYEENKSLYMSKINIGKWMSVKELGKV